MLEVQLENLLLSVSVLWAETLTSARLRPAASTGDSGRRRRPQRVELLGLLMEAGRGCSGLTNQTPSSPPPYVHKLVPAVPSR